MIKFVVIICILVSIIILLVWTKKISTKKKIKNEIKIIETPIKNEIKIIETSIENITILPTTITVWTYWEGKKSKLVDICLERIDRSCKSISGNKYIHIHLTNDTTSKYIDDDLDTYACYKEGSHVLKSDILRVYLLKKYGGIWLDASIFIMKPIDKIFPDFNRNYFQAFHNSRNSSIDIYPIIETSAMYSPPNFPLINDWFYESVKLLRCTDNDRIKYVKEQKLDINVSNLSIPYHYSYFTMLKILHNKSKGINSYSNVRLYSVLEYNYFCFMNFNKTDFLKLTTNQFISKYAKKSATMIKFISYERKFIDESLSEANSKCILNDKNLDIFNMIFWSPEDLMHNTPNLSVDKANEFFSSTDNKLNQGWWMTDTSNINNAVNRANCAIFASKLIRPKNFLEIGFNAGHSLNVILYHNPTIKNVVEFGLGECPKCLEYSKGKYPDVDIKYIKGYSRDTVPVFSQTTNTKYDLIHINGSHEEEDVYLDIKNCSNLAHENTILILDDCGGIMSPTQCCPQVCNAIIRTIEDNIIYIIPGCNRGSTIARYNFN